MNLIYPITIDIRASGPDSHKSEMSGALEVAEADIRAFVSTYLKENRWK